jgi:hypothetical protein
LRRQLVIVALIVLALRLPFLNQALQGDDVLYLTEAEHAQIEPLHPKHTAYVFMGHEIDMRGQSHPPLNGWVLAVLIGIFNDVSEIPFHTAYILFSLIAAFSALALARRFSPNPLMATLLFLATPAFVINGASLEADVPFVALWLLATALYVYAVDNSSMRILIASALAMALAGICAYQSVLLTPILFLYGRKWRAARMATLTPVVALLAWQLFECLSTGALPAGVLAGYIQSYRLEVFSPKLKSAVALTGHLAWLVFPILWLPPLVTLPVAIGAAFYDPNPLFWGSVAVGVGILIWCARNRREFPAQWVLVFFAGAVAIFFAGSARYLLPIALPVAILATRRAGLRLLKLSLGCGLALGLLLASVNYQHWDGYRQFAAALKKDVETKRAWINGEWGLRYYLESEGGVPLLQGQAIHPDEMVVTSDLSYPTTFTSGGGVMAPTAQRTITSRIPLRLVAFKGRAAYSTTLFGLRPFDISLAPIDQVRAEIMLERKPELTYLAMSAPQAVQQIAGGIYQLESGQWRWMGQSATVLLKPPGQPTPVVVRFTIPSASPAREITVELNGHPVASKIYTAPGSYTLASTPQMPGGESVTVTIKLDKSFSVQGDNRQLGAILTEIGFASLDTH